MLQKKTPALRSSAKRTPAELCDAATCMLHFATQPNQQRHRTQMYWMHFFDSPCSKDKVSRSSKHVRKYNSITRFTWYITNNNGCRIHECRSRPHSIACSPVTSLQREGTR